MSTVQTHDVARTPSTWVPQSVDDVRDAIREAAAMHTPLRIVGLGTWLDGGHPTSPDARPIHLSALEGITAYVPGDLTLTARAATPLSTIEAAAASENQWLPLDPFSVADHGGSIGATIATASAGPLAHAVGMPRDVVLGLEAVTGEGNVIRTGGRVVKNVAGFDLTRLLTGAWGTLGVLTEVTVRLRGRPACDETLAVVRRPAAGRGRQAEQQAIEELLKTLRETAVAPTALELLNQRMAARLALPGSADGPVVLARIVGNAERVAADRAALESIGDAVPVVPQTWAALRRAEADTTDGAAVLRWSQAPTRLNATWAHAGAACAAFADALIHASVGRGVVRVIIPDPGSAPLAAAIARDAASSREVAGGGVELHAPTGFAGICIPERLPRWLWGAVGSRAMRDPLSRRVRRAFDPGHILNPGVVGEGVDRD